jgi:hypothetical protein
MLETRNSHNYGGKNYLTKNSIKEQGAERRITSK